MLPSLLAMHACRYLKGSLRPDAESATNVSQVLHSINAHQLDLIHSMDGYLDKTVVPILKDVKTMWQPTDFLPDSSSPDFLDEVMQSLEYNVCFICSNLLQDMNLICTLKQGSLLLALLCALLSSYVG